jgi:low affinity Fe/Cu permease
MLDYIRRAMTGLGVLTARPVAFLIVAIYGVLWYIFSPETLEWHSVVALATLLMTLLIQRAEHRDTQAIHAKLDNLLEKIAAADTNLRDIDQKEPEEIETIRVDMHTPS